jgi:5-methylthioribose kinase
VKATTVADIRALSVEAGWVGPAAVFTELAGGVSSVIASVRDGDTALVVKSPREQLAVATEWRASRRRGAFEAAALSLLEGRLGPVRVPRLLFFDADLILLGEELIDGPCPTYKTELLEGRAHGQLAARLGQGLSILHQMTEAPGIDADEGRELFDSLRLDPYYRATARLHPDLSPALLGLVEETCAVPGPSLVHGDFSPKNVLVTPDAPVLVDWEVVHLGDPAFDVGMLSAHLLLKSVSDRLRTASEQILDALLAFWRAYAGPADPGRSLRHTGGIMLARLYGKSPVEYLPGAGERARADAVGRAALSGSRPVGELAAMAAAARSRKP